MEACAETETLVGGGRDDGLRAADPAGRTIERGEDAVAGRVNLDTIEVRQLAAHLCEMGREQVTPRAITHCCSPLTGADDVREEHSGEHTVGDRLGQRRPQEELDLGGDLVADEGRYIASGNTDCPRIRDHRRHRMRNVFGIASRKEIRRRREVLPEEDESRDADRREHAADVCVRHRAEVLLGFLCCCGAGYRIGCRAGRLRTGNHAVRSATAGTLATKSFTRACFY